MRFPFSFKILATKTEEETDSETGEKKQQKAAT